MIEAKYQMRAAEAADAMRAALLAVENCGADIELTNIVTRLADDRTKLCTLFALPPEQAFQEARLAADGLAGGVVLKPCKSPHDNCNESGHGHSFDHMRSY